MNAEQKQEQVFRRKWAVRGTTEWMTTQIETMEKATKDLREQQQRFIEAAREEEVGGKSTATLVSHLSWFVSSLTKFASGNLRIDNAVNHSAALALTQPKE